ncbi:MULTISPECIES: hypothetical protein [Pseudonocardia]|uniref:Uncharacterized protein n=2 Tax=Pseudonocardia TaxID=1847 RepID=A0A1Y2MKU2_PSEAH|nr:MULTISPECIES: hypothetical protein [Pseudonocardia]OSY35088.1 hypothetical protein BG845_06321 [Pseudonocardia autotrophica]TDN72107.1 hypothetical protein C8E95_1154 [Pseudonocardia autotrophica]BBG02811.1 hypothetical protein Pdca_40200 [Pseudonocardia autotrophica]GEC26130.1 hypothetical protein PSA01_31590 [Pseudonocardia saturnea]
MSARQRLARLAATVLAAVLLAVAAAGTALATPPPIGPPITNIATDIIGSDYRPDLVAQRHHTRIRLDAGTYTYGQTYDGVLTHDHTALAVPAGTYTLHDAVHDGLGGKVHVSYLDPAPDPTDPTSGVIVTTRPMPTRAKVVGWGSLLIRTR